LSISIEYSRASMIYMVQKRQHSFIATCPLRQQSLTYIYSGKKQLQLYLLDTAQLFYYTTYSRYGLGEVVSFSTISGDNIALKGLSHEIFGPVFWHV
jgi:hypothetical protein